MTQTKKEINITFHKLVLIIYADGTKDRFENVKIVINKGSITILGWNRYDYITINWRHIKKICFKK